MSTSLSSTRATGLVAAPVARAAPAKTIALVDWYWGGHHPTYFAYFVLALEQLGIRVLALCPEPDEAKQMVACLRGSMVPGACGSTEFRPFPCVPAGRWLPSRLYAIRRAIRHFRSIDLAIRDWQMEVGVSHCQIFYPCMYEWDFDYFKYAQRFLRLPWFGLYMRPAALPAVGIPRNGRRVTSQLDRISQDAKLRGLAILDEGLKEALSERVRRPVVVFPDFTDERMPGAPVESHLSTRLRAFAADRPIVGLFGHLQRSKGLTTLCAAAQQPALAHLCFAIVGEVDWLSFTPEERKIIQQWLADANNVWIHLARIPDERRLNALMAACTALFAAYINFPHSSNILTKAAVLEKPVVVSDGSLIAERVRGFSLGEIVPQEDPHATAAAILRVTVDVDRWVNGHQPQWQAFRKRHSFNALTAAFAEMLAPA